MPWSLYKERGLINPGGKSVKYGQEVLGLLEAGWVPKQIVVMHCRGHQKGETSCPGEIKKLIEKPREQPSQEDRRRPHRQQPCSHAPYLNGTHGILHKNRLCLRMKEEISCPGAWWNLPMAVSQSQSHWLPHLSSSSMKELTQGGQFLIPPWPSIFMSPSFSI
jgi:hypothetical protein